MFLISTKQIDILYSSDGQMTMIKCSNQDCTLGSWFHLECVGIQNDQMPGVTDDWWCSDDCRQTDHSILCRCKSVKNEAMVTCAGGENCENGFRFHLTCIGLSEEPRKYRNLNRSVCVFHLITLLYLF